jgi:hypothetical protein
VLGRWTEDRIVWKKHCVKASVLWIAAVLLLPFPVSAAGRHDRPAPAVGETNLIWGRRDG